MSEEGQIERSLRTSTAATQSTAHFNHRTVAIVYSQRFQYAGSLSTSFRLSIFGELKRVLHLAPYRHTPFGAVGQWPLDLPARELQALGYGLSTSGRERLRTRVDQARRCARE